MPMGWDELFVILILAVIIIGPQRMPEYAAKLARGIRSMRVMADSAKSQLREQMGPEFDDINWRQYDPRSYDPRKIVRDALREPLEAAWNPVRDELSSVRESAGQIGTGEVVSGELAPAADVRRPTPFDADAT
ncbi:MAG TPA: twin-arginine translocase TatA/TatE family subunit [Tetrasphaera sp.]|uniref:twin-arginine translocase TatA/TatE family subunit n=1 Tax=Nostocoides sp. TaxID=1917966 RepID=UPI002B593359|nr:twin-arginine translocase TatA/TatE family subunit [Tetrasphaera sp.]HNQ07118.1 twin-arginine translocase TatA/TatE family subunit [Tetrasphaera sp.]